jgi:hypothetical protein
MLACLRSLPSKITTASSHVIDGDRLHERREVELFEQCTGRQYNHGVVANTVNEPRLRRFIVLVGRRGGKDRFFSSCRGVALAPGHGARRAC